MCVYVCVSAYWVIISLGNGSAPYIGAKPLHKPVMAYDQMDIWEQTSVKFESNH